MRATCVEDLRVFRRATCLAAAVLAETRGFRSDFWLRDQINESAESAMSNISEGFRQPSDRAFARYLSIAAASLEETRSHLTAAEIHGHVPPARCAELKGEAREIANMLAAFIRYLRHSDRRDRIT